MVALGWPDPDADPDPDPKGYGKPLGSARHPLEPVLHELERELGDMQISLDKANDQAFVEAILDSEPNRLGDVFRRTLVV